jgi:hypothetical protein
MKSAGIREAKARLSELAAKGEVTILTDYGKPIAMRRWPRTSGLGPRRRPNRAA